MTLIPLVNYRGIVNLDNFLLDEEVNEVVERSLNISEQPGTIAGESILNTSNDILTTRICNVKWIIPNEPIQWLFNKLQQYSWEVNQNFFHLDLNSIEPLQYTIYNAPGDTYHQHSDVVQLLVNHRKLSFTIQLSDPSEYEGGELLIYPETFQNPVKANIKKGSITFFYSHYVHEVTPVTKGTRKALVGWFSGPPLK